MKDVKEKLNCPYQDCEHGKGIFQEVNNNKLIYQCSNCNKYFYSHNGKYVFTLPK